MIYLPDTNVWIKYLNPGDSMIKVRIAHLKASEIRLCAIVKTELLYGAYKSNRREDNITLIQRLFERFNSLPFDDLAAKECAQIRAELAIRGTPIGPNDLMIAAIAIANDLMLVTHNTREFKRVDGLGVVDWEMKS